MENACKQSAWFAPVTAISSRQLLSIRLLSTLELSASYVHLVHITDTICFILRSNHPSKLHVRGLYYLPFPQTCQ